MQRKNFLSTIYLLAQLVNDNEVKRSIELPICFSHNFFYILKILFYLKIVVSRGLSKMHRAVIATKNAYFVQRCGVHSTAAPLLGSQSVKQELTELVVQASIAEPQEEHDKVHMVPVQRDFKLHRLELGPSKLVALKENDALLYYRQMLAIRRLEWAASELYKEKLIRGFCHLYTGQEACAVGMCAAMRPQDNLIAGYRIHGMAYLMGLTAQDVLAELLGRASGCARGKGGSMHMYAPHFYGGNGIVGAQVALGTGIAWASRYQCSDAVCLACYGDGAANQGQIFECFNMAQLWRLPIVFVCENNNYGMGTSAWRASCSTNYYTRGDSLPGIWVDGQDVLAVRSASQFAIEHAQQRGPLILELSTYRYAGHSMSDPGTSYRSREEVQQVRRQQDPVSIFRQLCLEKLNLPASLLGKIEEDVRRECQQAINAAKSSTELPLSQLSNDVYANGGSQAKIRGISEYNLPHLTLGKGTKCREHRVTGVDDAGSQSLESTEF